MTLSSDVGKTISAVAKVIPQGWEIDVRIIRGGVCVALYGEDGELVQFIRDGHEWWADDIEYACEHAISNASHKGAVCDN
jgi:hypothetical protein